MTLAWTGETLYCGSAHASAVAGRHAAPEPLLRVSKWAPPGKGSNGPRAPEGRAHVGCATCGNVATAVLDPGEPGPWCIHHDGTYVWRKPAAGSDWTRMQRVDVTWATPDAERRDVRGGAGAGLAGAREAAAVRAVLDVLEREIGMPHMARIRDFTPEQVEAGELREADEAADRANAAFGRKIVEAVLGALG